MDFFIFINRYISCYVEYACNRYIYYTIGYFCQNYSRTYQGNNIYFYSCTNILNIVQELRKKFEKSSDEVDSALSRYMSKKPKDPTLQEVRNYFIVSYEIFICMSSLQRNWLIQEKYFINLIWNMFPS